MWNAIVLLVTSLSQEPALLAHNDNPFKTKEACEAVIAADAEKLIAGMAARGKVRGTDYEFQFKCVPASAPGQDV